MRAPWLRTALAGVFAMSLTAFADDGLRGSIDVRDTAKGTSGGAEVCRFEIEGQDLAPQQTGDWWVQEDDGGNGDRAKAVLLATYAADATGDWAAGPFDLDDGRYRLFVRVSDAAHAASGVALLQRSFDVRCPVPPPALRVQGNRLLDPSGRPVVFRGVNRMGLEFSCVQGKGLPYEAIDRRTVDAIKSWRLNAVRLPLNEHCWLGVGGEPSGEAYRQGVVDYVELLVRSDLYVILDLHWSAPSPRSATALDPMPNTDHSVDFWSSVATRFKGEERVIFDLFNEPFPNSNQRDDTDEVARRSWQCWRDGGTGGTCDSVQLGGLARGQVAGMQSLVDAVRATGATNVIMLSGIQFGNTLWSNARRNWLTYRPVDPLNRLVAAFHTYNETWCQTVACLETEVAPIAAHVPVVAAEIGNGACDASWMIPLLRWLDQREIGYLAWTWNVGAKNDCASKKLIVDDDGTPSAYGEIFRAHLASR
jgi:endoglucanase